jgi:formylglycine-generating enzyme required for sulfatase activity
MRLLSRRIRSFCLVSAMLLLALTACGDGQGDADVADDVTVVDANVSDVDATDAADVTCVPACGVRVCGFDPVCGTLSCGTCDDQENCNASGACVPKVPVCPAAKDCTGLECGVDPVCGESCGTCGDGYECLLGICEPSVCIADCTGLECGVDPVCGESCGTCGDGYECLLGICEPSVCVADCTGLVCGPDPVCGQSCGTCGEGYTCESGACVEDACVPVCGPAVCGLDLVCGTQSCGTCSNGFTCQSGACVENTVYGDMVLIPAGSFWMGCNTAVDSNCSSDESPYHQVTLSAYYMDKTEVTVTAYGECVTAGACTAPSTYYSYCNWNVTGKEDHPVNCITWFQSEAYCAWAGKRLPTEAEWEKAARGTDGRKYPWGNETATCDYAVMYEGGNGCGTESTMPVCSKSPAGDSPYGLCDMSGNVWEWVSDWYDSSYYSSSPGTDPVGPASGSLRVFRGGSLSREGFYLRASDRFGNDPSGNYGVLGARCARPQ